MEFRSTNDRYAHFQGDVVTNVSSGGVGNSSHGVHLTGGSTGAIIQPAGDEASIALNIRSKGAGPFNLGTSTSGQINLTSSQVNLASTLITISSGAQMQVGSTAPWGGFVRYIDTAVTTPALFNDTDAGRVAESTHTLVGASSMTAGGIGHFLMANSVNLPAAVAIGGCWLGSTTDQVHVRFIKGSTVAVAGTTCTLQFLLTRF